jgi:isoleucyl-tRNA synthetase
MTDAPPDTSATTSNQDPAKRYAGTVRLPKTAFPMKANLPQLEERLLKDWDAARLYERIMEKNAGRPLFVMHDGPPYANGSIHHGHILNKVLKDMVVKYRNMTGWLCHFVPGWDCHGLPIELNVDKALGKDKINKSRPEIRALCRKEAERWIDVQRRDFQRLGVLGAWETPYLTIQPSYEATVVRELARFADGRGLHRGFKPVHWCWSCQTALAEAEVEHENHRSPSVYVTFPVTDEATRRALSPALAGEKVSALIWTTTPWTLPANRAIAYGPKEFRYAAFKVAGSDERVIVASDLKGAVEAEVKRALTDPVPVDMEAVCVRGKEDARGADHPFLADGDRAMRVPFVPADHVTLERGTGLVHTAPGHGPEDFVVGRKFGLEVANPVGPDGRYQAGVGVASLVGKHVARATKTEPGADPEVVQVLVARGRLLSPPDLGVEHEYPHCWRCKNPVIFRATEQWFISMDQAGLRRAALEALDKVQWIPSWGIQRIRGMLEARPDWCMSRQRAWGVPIPAFVCKGCGQSTTSRAVMEHVAAIFEKEGADAWWLKGAADLVPPGLVCGGCGKADWALEQDILDVWFESGASWAAVCGSGVFPHLQLPVDLYLEGSDQHRGWFHSSLLCAVGGRGVVPYKAVLTHGFVVDEKGRKYSKSNPRYVPPDQTIKKSGAELMRLWVAATDYTGDIHIGEEILTRLVESYRKTRNTLRFLLGNLSDFNPATDMVPREELPPLERWVLARVSRLTARLREAYETYQFHVVHHAVNELVTVALSSFYLDVTKDVMYCDAETSRRRRSAQTAMWHTCRALLSLVAPILSFTAEEAWGHLPKLPGMPESVHLAEMPTVADGYDREDAESVLERFDRLLGVRTEVQRALEGFRAQKHHPLEAKVELACPADLRGFLAGFEDLPGLFGVSAVQLVEQADGEGFTGAEALPGLQVRVSHAPGSKCPRCWVWSEEIGSAGHHAELCDRCARVVG